MITLEVDEHSQTTRMYFPSTISTFKRKQAVIKTEDGEKYHPFAKLASLTMKWN